MPASLVRSLLLSLAVACVAIVSSASTPQEKPCDDPCGVRTPWNDFNGFQLRVTSPNQPGYAQWEGSFDRKTDDIQINVEISKPGSVAKGKILMIGGRVMAVQGPIIEPGYEIDSIDTAILQLQLVVRLLGRAFPDGPASIKATQPVDYSDSKTSIQIATPSADALLQAPWHVKGALGKVQSGAVHFDLTFAFAGTGIGESERDNAEELSGELSNISNAKIDDKLSLEKWDVFGVGPQARKQNGSTIVDYSAAPEATTYRNVADVRKKLEADDYPGERDASKDFTGFWKSDCENAYGLSIEHFGTDGKYSIVFCGPGGCGDPAASRKTFITKDAGYQVISEDEIREKLQDGWETYHRCTREAHPILRYKDDK